MFLKCLIHLLCDQSKYGHTVKYFAKRKYASDICITKYNNGKNKAISYCSDVKPLRLGLI